MKYFFCHAVDADSLEMESDNEQEAHTADNPDSSLESPQCECQCCIHPNTPYQPMDVMESKTTHSHLSKKRQAGKVKSYSRKIQPSWYKKYPWITVCTSKYRIFCVSAKEQGLLTFTKHQNQHLLIKALAAGTRQSKDLTTMKEVKCIKRL